MKLRDFPKNINRRNHIITTPMALLCIKPKDLKIITTPIYICSASLGVYIVSLGVQLDLFPHDMVISRISRNFDFRHVNSHHIGIFYPNLFHSDSH